MSEPTTQAGQALVEQVRHRVEADEPSWDASDGYLLIDYVHRIEAEAAAAVRRDLAEQVRGHERIAQYGPGWLPQWGPNDWHCRCGSWGNHAADGFAHHVFASALAILDSRP